MMINRKIDLSKILAGIVVVGQVHQTLKDLFPEYASSVKSIAKKIKKKLWMHRTLLDIFNEHLGTKHQHDIISIDLDLEHPSLEFALHKFLFEKLKVSKVLQQSDEESPAANRVAMHLLESKDARNYEVLEPESVFVSDTPPGPECWTDKEEERILVPHSIVFAHYDGIPVIVNSNEDDESGSVVTLMISIENHETIEKIALEAREFLKENNPFKGWVITCQTTDYEFSVFDYVEDLCEQLRIEPADIDFDIYSDDVKRMILRDIGSFVKHVQNEISDVHFDGRRSYLLEGPPGTGKTNIIKTIISTLPEGFTTIILDHRNIEELNVLKDHDSLFPALVVIEDIDLLLSSKKYNQILLNFLDGMLAPDKMITVMTSNNKDKLIKSLLHRPGRIDRIIHVGPGNESMRKAQLEALTQNVNLPDDVTHESIAEQTDGFTVAELRELVRRTLVYSESGSTMRAEPLMTALVEMQAERKDREN